MSGWLSTHILDTANGIAAEGVAIGLFELGDNDARRLLQQTRTNADGRTDAPLITADGMRQGSFELLFHVGDYFRSRGEKISTPAFLDLIPIRFQIADPTMHYHVPLLVSPWSYSTYRGT